MSKNPVHRDYKLATYFILISVCAGIFKIVSVYSKGELSDFNTYFGLGLNVFILFLLIWLGINISKGKNWARITFVVISACLLIFAPLFLINEFKASPLIGSMSTIFGVCLLIAMLLLYSKGARKWHSDQLNS